MNWSVLEMKVRAWLRKPTSRKGREKCGTPVVYFTGDVGPPSFRQTSRQNPNRDTAVRNPTLDKERQGMGTAFALDLHEGSPTVISDPLTTSNLPSDSTVADSCLPTDSIASVSVSTITISLLR